MKQYTTPEQTAKLMELGFEPSTRIPFEVGNDELGRTFSIDVLIEMLPPEINNDALPDRLEVYTDHNKMWTVEYSNVLGEILSTYRTELIDALYDMVVKLKEEGVI